MSAQSPPSSSEDHMNPVNDILTLQNSSICAPQNDIAVEPQAEPTENQEPNDTDRKSDDSEQTSNKSRELKSLLALSKEANLSTNIPHKRKKDVKDSPRNSFSEIESKKSLRINMESKQSKFPVTAEAELEELHENEIKGQVDSSKIVKRKRDSLQESASGTDTEEIGKRHKKSVHGDYKVFKVNKDIFCWRCHREGVNIVCETCPRSYHQKCLKQTIIDATHWPCPECVAILKAESTQTRSPAMKGMTLEHLCSLLKFAVNRMIQCQGSEPFLHPVSDKEFPEYKKYIIQPMDLTMLEKNIKDNLYGSTQAFEADAKWLLHNSIIFNSYQSKLTSAAKTMIKICKQEMMEIENCPSCYLKANTKKSTWFVEVCPKPHILVWAKLKGFPYWPAKAMSISPSGMVDVRFFGAHDRAWVQYKECYLYSEKDPNTFKQKRFDIEKCVEELNVYIDNLKKIYGEFRYAPFRTPLKSDDLYKQLPIFLPKYKTVQARRKSIRESLETKHEEEATLKVDTVPKEEPLEEPEKSETSSNAHSNINSPVQDHDTTMEGYGTDDDMHSELDHECRKTLGKKNSNETEDEDDEDDTQVPSNIPIEVILPRGKVRTRGGFNNSTGKLKFLPRLSLEQHLSDDPPPSSQKTSRRNSDQSVKSDSSRVSNVSDKINRVNISENMDITLGNEDIGCVSISENKSPPNDDTSRSGSEHNYEIKKKPVQLDIENAEFSISPNKVKISDQLIKKLTDVKQVEVVKKSVVELDRINMQQKPSDISVNGNVESSLDQENIDIDDENKNMTTSETVEKSKQKILQPSITEYIMVTPKEKKENVNLEALPLSNKDNKTSEKLNSNVGDLPSAKDQEVSSLNKTNLEKENDILSTSNKGDKSKNDTENLSCEKVENDSTSETLPSTSENISSPVTTKKSLSSSQKSDNQKFIEESLKNKDIQLISLSESKYFTMQTAEKEKLDILEQVETSNKLSSKTVLEKFKNTADKEVTVSKIKPTSTEIDKSNKYYVDIVDQSEEMEDTETIYNKKKIFDVIHSSLKSVEIEKNKNTDRNKEKDSNVDVSNKKNEFGKTIPEKEITKKRKSSSEDEHTPAKVIKLVSIDSILNKNNSKEELEKIEISKIKKTSEKPTPQLPEDMIAPEDIKSEPESGDEIMADAMQMEEKRKYLSALNIHEKTADDGEKKEKMNEIRTRSKAEEKRERFKVVDNLTRIIDDVAMNYSALHDGEILPQRKPERRKSNTNVAPQPDGEIYVKSFAKIPTPPPAKQRARKTFPIPSYTKQPLRAPFPKKDLSILRKEQPSQITLNSAMPPKSVQEKDTSSSNKSVQSVSVTTPNSSTSVSLPSQTTSSVIPNTSVTVPTSYNVVTSSSMGLGTALIAPSTQSQTMAMGHVILVQGPPMVNYCPPINNTGLNPVSHSMAQFTGHSPQSLLKNIPTPNLKTSQNYIPHNDTDSSENSSSPVITANHSSMEISISQTSHDTPEVLPVCTTASFNTNTTVANNNTPVSASIEEDDFGVLTGIVPESVSRAVSEMLLRPPPRLKPRPPSITSQHFDDGIPSSAGDTTAKVNSIAHRMSDYFRGMLIETLEDMGKTSSPEAKITSLQLEIEALKHRHSLEMAEMRKNMCTILKDIQRSVMEEREKIVSETRAACENETIRRVELAKSKQWCSNCPKEAQFYCCWNTSYCDYPCQQKHWPQHAGKCTQSLEKSTGTGVTHPSRSAGSPLILRPALAPPKPMGRIIAKPTKVYVNKANTPQKTVKTVPTSGLTLVETTPGNYELLGNGSIGLSGKLFNTSSPVGNTIYKTAPSSSGTPTHSSDQTKKTTSNDNKSQFII